jgi:hypothetical protein
LDGNRYSALGTAVIAERYVFGGMQRLDGRNAQCLGDEISLKSCGCLLRCVLAWFTFGTVTNANR